MSLLRDALELPTTFRGAWKTRVSDFFLLILQGLCDKDRLFRQGFCKMAELCFPKSRKGALMDFVRYADSVRAKLHMGGARLPVVIGITAAAICVLVAGGVGLASVVAPDSAFTVEKADASYDESEQANPAQSESAALFVHVGGSVANPGLYELAGDARVQQAVDAAGGFAEDAAVDALNLARQIQDGEQIIVPSMQQVTGSGAPVSSDSGAPAASSGGAFVNGKVDINTATVDQLQQLNGVGPALAQRIVADRQANGPFKTVEDLKRVSGIGDKKYASLADSICVG